MPRLRGPAGHDLEGRLILDGQEEMVCRSAAGARFAVGLTERESSSTRSTVSPGSVIVAGRCRAPTLHARLRVAGVAAPPLPAGFWSCAMLCRSASMRLITRRGAANVGFSSRTAPACLAFRCASSASS